MDLADIEKIVRILQTSDVTDFELEQGGIRLRLTRSTAARGSQNGIHVGYLEPAITNINSSTGQELAGNAALEENAAFTKVESPIVGTFYRKASPDSEPFVNVGDSVKKGQTLCIIEAMKLMNEIPSPCSGKIEKILLNDGQVAEYGEVLFLITADQ
jgi:acetyl-CoA carboxylase biotin carboxyl carrier protein